MRISTNKRDPAYMPPERRKLYRVWVGDLEVKNVITADSDMGFVLRAITTPEGKMIVNPLTRGVATQRLHGHVRIVETKPDNPLLGGVVFKGLNDA